VDLAMKTLATASRADVVQICGSLAAAYREWIATQEAVLAGEKNLADDLFRAARRHLDACVTCLSRISDGVQLLSEDDHVLDAFQMMNTAMLEQREHYALSSESERRRGWQNLEGSAQPTRSYVAPEYSATKWRPFQLAFVLMNLRPMRQPDCAARAAVDVIWFPTGGGKTEAYLGLAAFTILLRRLLKPANAGTTVLMRYTLLSLRRSSSKGQHR
jgi:hypothetical protein